MSADNPQYRPENVRSVLESWIQGKQDAFAHALFKALEGHEDGLKKTTIVSAISRAKAGTNEDSVKQLFGTPARRRAFAEAAGRPLEELEAELGADPSHEPLVFFVAEDVARHRSNDLDSMTSLMLVVRVIADAGCAPRILTSEPWRARLQVKETLLLDEWRARGWVVDLPMPWGAFRDGIVRAYESVKSRPKAWIRGESLGSLPVLQSLRVSVDLPGVVEWAPPGVLSRLRHRGWVTEPPRPAPEEAPNGSRLELVTLAELARRASATLESEPFKPLEIETRESLQQHSAETMAALIEIARGHPLSDVAARRDRDPWNLPRALEPLTSHPGPLTEWGEAARLVLSLGHLLDEKTALPIQVVEQALRLGGAYVDREQLLRDNPRAAIVQSAADAAFLLACERHAVTLEGTEFAAPEVYLPIMTSGPKYDPGIEFFVEESIGTATRLRRLALRATQESTHCYDPAEVAARLVAEGKAPATQHPMELLFAAAQRRGPPEPVYERRRDRSSWSLGEPESLPERWDLAERAIAALVPSGEPLADIRGALLELLARPLASLSVVHMHHEYELREIKTLGRRPGRVRRLGPFVTSAYEAPGTNLEVPILENLLRLKVAVCHGEALEVSLRGARGLVVSGPGSYRGTVRAWRTRASCDGAHAVLVSDKCLKFDRVENPTFGELGRVWIGGGQLFAEISTDLVPHRLRHRADRVGGDQ